MDVTKEVLQIADHRADAVVRVRQWEFCSVGCEPDGAAHSAGKKCFCEAEHGHWTRGTERPVAVTCSSILNVHHWMARVVRLRDGVSIALFMMVGCTHSCTATSASNVAANTYNDIEGVVNLSCVPHVDDMRRAKECTILPALQK